ncbi:hypothetical protein B0J14DRAFT_587534 [Halenospora varia]|nr:hypothetical protein B0J14DRAFT_587534 [Halenospora varia]
MLSTDSSAASTISIDNDDLNSSRSTEDDLILPAAGQVEEIFARSRHVWQGYLERAKSMHHIRPESLKLSNLLHRLPALPDDLKGVSFLQGQSTWKLNTHVTCSLESRTGTEQRWKPILSRGRPTRCRFSAQIPFSDWQDETNRTERASEHNNGVFIMLAGWAYILSKRLLEKQGLSMQFSTKLAPVTDYDMQRDAGEHCVTVDVGDVTPDELLWWRALLAPGQGWQASTSQQPPWAITYEGDLTFRVATTAGCLKYSQSERPPSSRQALQFLSRFSARYSLGIQSSAALAMALTLPLLNEAASTVQVPKPRLGKACISSSATLGSHCQLLQDFENISKCMTLSSNPRFLSSALWSTFWEPGVDCNLVSPWCDGITEILEPLIRTGSLELLAHILALRRPNLAALWYGIALFGRTKIIEALIPFLKTLRAPTPARPIPEVAFWTGSPQSFMDLYGSGPYLREDNTISRADVWRLRHDCWEVEPEGLPFRTTPLSGWPPFGAMHPEELELEVRRHISCERHKWQYDRWTWQLGNERYCDEVYKGEHEGWSSEFESHSSFHPEPKIEYKPDHVATETAVGEAFRWAATEIEFSSRSIYTHPWVGVDDFPEQDDPFTISTPSFSEEARKRVGNWREACEQGTCTQ